MIKEKMIKIGKRELIYNKRVLIAGENDPIEFELEITEDKFPVVLEFLFKNTDDEKASYSVSSEEIKNGGFRYVFTLKNFNNSLGTGTINPIELLSSKKEKKETIISLMFLVHKIGDSNRTLDVSLYEE